MSNSSIQIAGKRTALGKSLGRGGEGDVFALVDHADLAVKVYKETLRRSREAKVRAMVESRLADKTTLVSFPSEVATDGSGAFAGFTMRLVSGYRPIHELYSPKSRKIQFPKADYRFLVQVAQNVSRAVATVHQAGCVIGDFNHSGVLVASNATVALIDADSFQFKLNGRSYPCVVGTEDFTPPELHGKNLAQVERTQAHDNFGLAVAIFQLLAMGKHPYMGRYGGGDLSLGQAIAQHRFAYSIARQSSTRTTPPPASIQLSDLPLPVAQAFEAAFGLDSATRPDPATWIQLLEELKTNLRQCSAVPTHYFPHAAQSCVWCRTASQSGVEMFPPSLDSLTNAHPSAATGPFDLGKIAAAIRAVPFPRPEDVLPVWKGDLGAPLPAFKRSASKRANSRWAGALLLIGALVAFANGIGGGVLGIALLAISFYQFASAKPDASPLLAAYNDADNRVRTGSLAHLQRVGFTELFLVRNEMENYIGEYHHLEAKLTRDLADLKATREARQRHAFLDRCLLGRVKIPGIGPAKLAALASFSIESAADINYGAVMAVPGFGEALTQKLMKWRRDQEAKFRYNPTPDPSDRQAEDALRAAAAQRRAELQKRLQSGLAALQSTPSRLARSKTSPAPALMQALADRARAERDCASLGIKVPPHAPLNLPAPRPVPAPVSPTHSSGTRSPAPPPYTASPAAAPTSPHTSAMSCPICHGAMVRRKARVGRRAGKYFWGCSRYPQCHGTRN